MGDSAGGDEERAVVREGWLGGHGARTMPRSWGWARTGRARPRVARGRRVSEGGAELAELEAVAVELARGAGEILRRRFGRPLNPEFKSKKKDRDPVTDADRESEEFLRGEITRRLPEHAIISEEHRSADPAAVPEYVWVLDPLDGTGNFLNGMPVYGVCVGLLRHLRPVVGALYLPSTRDPQGEVLHGRQGGGAWVGNERLAASASEGPLPRNLSTVPTFATALWRFGGRPWEWLGEARSTGSIAYELGLAARGVLQYCLFTSPAIWDVAAGIPIIQEAGGQVMTRRHRSGPWEAFSDFWPATKGDGDLDRLRNWRAPILAGGAAVVPTVARHLHPRRRWTRRLTGLIRRR